MRRSAIVLGGGIAGLSAAIGLRRAGYDVEIFEQAATLEPVGAAISLWPNAIAALRRLDAAAAIEEQAAPIRTVRLATRPDRTIMGPWSIEPGRHGAPAFLPTRALVQQALREALGGQVDLHLSHRAERVVDQGSRAMVRFANGEERDADLVIAADGLWSATATALLRNPTRSCGYGGVLALSEVVEGGGPDGLAIEYWGWSERFGLFDLGGGRRYWFYLASEPHAPLDRDDLLEKARGWPAPVAAAIAATPAERLIPVSIHARTAPKLFGRGRIVCVGDAVHGMEPNLGQGACQALEDAAVLADLAHLLPPEAVAPALGKIRRRRVAAMMRRAREGGLAVHGPPPVQALARTALRMLPAAVHLRMIDDQYRLPVR